MNYVLRDGLKKDSLLAWGTLLYFTDVGTRDKPSLFLPYALIFFAIYDFAHSI